MGNSIIKDKTITTRVTMDISERAKKNLAKQGLTVSEYIRLSLVKAANNEVQLVNFLDTQEAQNAKQEAEKGQLEQVGMLNDFNDWINEIDEN